MYVVARLNSNQTHQVERFEREQDLKVFVLDDMDLRPSQMDPEKQIALMRLEKHLGKHIVAFEADDFV